nr:unnamed protein product [Spirometra erinaceieuropaei]
MKLRPGISVLNIGSGTGFLSTMFGLVLGSNGVNHGIEVSASNFAFAKSRLAEFMATSDAVYECDFCPPHFILGNIFSLVPISPQISSPAVFVETTTTDRLPSLSPILSAPSPGLPDFSEEIRQQSSETQNPREDGESQTSESDGDDQEDDDNVGDDEIVDHEPVINCSGDIIIEMPPLIEVPFPPATTQTREVPQFHHATTSPLPATSSVWPMYDRIYVGSAITSQAQLGAILRLLKVNGFMIAPVNDRFMKITRTSKNKTSAYSLLSVSFASLIPPGKNAIKIDPLPERSVERLERLASRAIRRILRRIINTRRGGPPVLGRHVEVSDDEEEEGDRKQTASVDAPVKAVFTNGDHLRRINEEPIRIDEIDHKVAEATDEPDRTLDSANRISTPDAATLSSDSASSSLGSQAPNAMSKRREPELDAREPSPSKKRCEEESGPATEASGLIATLVSSDDPPQESQTQGQDREVDWGRTRARIYSPYMALLASILNPRTRVINLRQLEQLRESDGASDGDDNGGNTSAQGNHDGEEHRQSGEGNEQENEGRENAASDEDEETDRRGRRKKTKFEWVPQSYTYREEMYRLLSTELAVPDFLAQRIMAVI